MKLNNKGYMLVEIILASILAMSLAYYLLNITYEFKNKDEDLYYNITYMTDKTVVTKNIMNDILQATKISSTSLSIVPDTQNSNLFRKSFNLTVKTRNNSNNIIETTESRTLEIRKTGSGTEISYGQPNGRTGSGATAYLTNDISYYHKKLSNSLQIDLTKITVSENAKGVAINIPISSLYDDKDYSIKLFLRK